jgi:hypothetical protein
MHWRLLAVATALIVVGSALAIAPIDQGTTYSTTLDSGQWLDIAVPTTAAWTGAPVDVLLSWGTAYQPSCRGPQACFSPPVGNVTSLLVLDCGLAPCTWDRNYSVIGSTEPEYGGSSGFVALPGHHYQVWLMAPVNASPGISVPVRYALETPILGGVFGAVGVAWGILAAVEAARRWRARRTGDAVEKAFL